MRLLTMLLFYYFAVPLSAQVSEATLRLVESDQIQEQDRRLDDLGVNIAQIGNSNLSQASVTTQGILSSVIVNQIGDLNRFEITATTTNSDIDMVQQGNSNFALLLLGSDLASTLQYFQIGDANTLRHDLGTSTQAEVTFIQEGTNHVLDVQTNDIQLSGMKITQTGNAAQLIIKE